MISKAIFHAAIKRFMVSTLEVVRSIDHCNDRSYIDALLVKQKARIAGSKFET